MEMSMNLALISFLSTSEVLYTIEQKIFLKEFPQKFEWMQDELRRMQCFLKDSNVEQTPLTEQISELRKLAYDAEDLISYFLLERESRKKRTVLYHIKLWFSKQRIIKDFNAINDKRLQIINNHSRFTSPPNPPSHPQQPSYKDFPISDIVGLENETEEVVKQLRDKEMRRSVVSIVGMGGIGKSTLASKVFQHPQVESTFDLRAWVSVTQRFNDYRDGVLVNVLLSSRQEGEEDRTERLDRLSESLKEKRYLVVLDDVWGPPHQSLWDGRLLEAFPDVQNGSRIMITTRMNDVAEYLGTHSVPINLKHLDDHKSWELFCKEASIGTNDRAFRDIVKKILSRCGGLPLSIVTMGRKFKEVRSQRRADWEKKFKEMEGSPLPDEVLKRLESSYHELTPELQSCFLRLSSFPKNHTFRAQKLIHIWISEGLISEQEGGGIEATAESHLDLLVERNMVQPTEISPEGKIKACQIHNSLQELTIIKAKEEILLGILEDDILPTNNIRYGAIHRRKDRYFDTHQKTTSPLRSLIFTVPNGRISLEQFKFMCKRFKLLTVLHLESMRVVSLPDEVGNLQYLRYLNLRNCNINKLQSSMSNLKKLLTLDIRDNNFGTDMRDNTFVSNLHVIKDMTGLHNLYLPGFYEGLVLDGLGQIHTLKSVKVANNEMLESLAKLTTLRVLQLKLEGLLSLEDLLKSMKELKQLESLHLYPNIEISSLDADFTFLTSLTKLYFKGGVRQLPSCKDFPPKLMQFTLDGSALIPFPLEDLAQLRKLSILRLRNLYIKEEKLSFGSNGFPRLKYLELVELWNLKELEFEEGALPRLKHLKISNCTALGCLPREMQCMTKLSELHINKMSDTFEKKIQSEVENRKRVQHVPFIKFTNTLKSYEDI